MPTDQNTPINYQPLAEKASATTVKTSLLPAVLLIGGGLGIAGIVIAVQLPDSFTSALPVLGVLFVVLVAAAYFANRYGDVKTQRWIDFAAANGFAYQRWYGNEPEYSQRFMGSLFYASPYHVTGLETVSGMYDRRPFECGVFDIIGGRRNRKPVAFISLGLPAPLPRAAIDGPRALFKLGRASDLAEGEWISFSDPSYGQLKLRCDPAFHQGIAQVITPELLRQIHTFGKAFSLEIKGQQLILYRYGRLGDPRLLFETCFSLASLLHQVPTVASSVPLAAPDTVKIRPSAYAYWLNLRWPLFTALITIGVILIGLMIESLFK